MKITVYYEDNRERTTIEVPDSDCEIWVETDYRERLQKATDKSAVKRRTPQQIMDEECDKPTYNSHHRESRRHVSFDALDPLGDTIVGSDDIDLDLTADEYADLHREIDKLQKRQKEMLRKVFWEDMKQVEIARAEGVGESAVAQRMAAIVARLRKILDSEK